MSTILVNANIYVERGNFQEAMLIENGIIKAVGIIILGWGVVQVGMSIQSHDASQRTQGLLCLFGGLLIAFAKEILTLIGAV